MSFSNYIGQTLDGKYQIENEIGRGGMGTVFLATHLGTERPVALKIIAPQFMQRAEFVERFRREARAAGRLRHPNVVDVTDFGITDSINGKTAYLVMEYLDGCTLGEILEEEKQLPLAWTLDILEQVCSAVNEAHEQGIIHRDLKPDNIWLEPNQRGGYTVKVLDFGIAKLEENTHEPVSADYSFKALPFSSARATVADLAKDETKADQHGGATMISESATMAQIPESGTIISEKGTLIQTIQPEPEDKTAIFQDNQTAILTPEDIGTQIISEQIDTNRLAENNFTGRSIKSAKSTSELTRVGAVLGTPLFMSPEQCKGEKLSPRSDIYSLGVIAYRMLSGKTPFDGDHTVVMEAHKEIEPPPLIAKGVPGRIKKVIYTTLSKNPDERPQTAEAFASKMRSQSEGFGVLLQKALVIYTQHLPKFLLLALIISIPHILSSVIRFSIGLMASFEIIGLTTANLVVGAVSIVSFFLQIFAAAFLVGTVTWIVAQILAVPLRPVSIRAALSVAWSKRKPLLTTVTFQSLLSLFGMALCILPGIYWSTTYMLITPAIMMEGVKGRAAFRRSKELVRRATLTAFTLAILMYVVPFAIGGIVGGAIALIAKSAVTQSSNGQANIEESEDLKIKIGNREVSIDTNEGKNDELSEEEKSKKRLAATKRNTLTQGLMDLILSPIMLFLTSLSSVITALMYFKTRQAGGESMQGLLEQFEEKDQPRKKWQERVRNRLIQSGRITSGTSKS